MRLISDAAPVAPLRVPTRMPNERLERRYELMHLLPLRMGEKLPLRSAPSVEMKPM
jgi:hypothetical protein